MADKYIFNPISGNMDLVRDVSGFVPYVGATADVNLGSKNLVTEGYIIGQYTKIASGNISTFPSGYYTGDKITLTVLEGEATENQISLSFSDGFKSFYPKNTNEIDLGREIGIPAQACYFKNLYLTNNLSDGTNELTIANIKTAYDYLDQAVKTTSSPIFADLTLTGNITSTMLSTENGWGYVLFDKGAAVSGKFKHDAGFELWRSDATAYGTITWHHKSRGTVAVPLVPSSNDIIGGLGARVWDGDSWVSSGRFSFKVAGTVDLTNAPTKFVVETMNGQAGGLVEQLVIDQTGAAAFTKGVSTTTGFTAAGALTGGIGLTLDGTAGASAVLDRNAVNNWAEMVFRTGGTTFWNLGLSGDNTNNFYLEDAASNKMLTVVDLGATASFTLASTSPLQFRDTATYIFSPGANLLTLVAPTLNLQATTLQIGGINTLSATRTFYDRDGTQNVVTIYKGSITAWEQYPI